MEQQPPTANSRMKQCKSQNAPFSHRWLRGAGGGRGGTNFPSILSMIVGIFWNLESRKWRFQGFSGGIFHCGRHHHLVFCLFLPPWLNCTHSGKNLKISSPCRSKLTKLSFTVKTDDVWTSGSTRAVTGGSGVHGLNDFFPTNIEVKELTVTVIRMYLHGA